MCLEEGGREVNLDHGGLMVEGGGTGLPHRGGLWASRGRWWEERRYLEPHLATVTPNKVLPQLRETVNTSSSVLFTKGQHFVDACLTGTCLSCYGVSGSIVIPILHTTLFLENREARVSQVSHSSLAWCMYV